jgi:hypothetical protein
MRYHFCPSQLILEGLDTPSHKVILSIDKAQISQVG